jgi:phosphatidylinositol alpha-1,6-mannosyltransferase
MINHAQPGAASRSSGILLFISRKYPPSVGGMEQLSYYMTTGVARQRPAQIIKWDRSQMWLLLFIPVALVQALIALVTTPVAMIHIGDLVLAPLGWFLRLVSRKPVAITAHGLDVVYPNFLYQWVIPTCVRHLDAVICISEHTRQACLARGVCRERTIVIPVGVDPNTILYHLSGDDAAYWLRRWGQADRAKRRLLTTGRLVQRKGVYFFIDQVLPRLRARRDDWVYLVIGDGPEREAIATVVRERGLEDVVQLLGRVPDDELRAAYALADVFVMPNIHLPGDSEGFGIVTVEARMAGLPVVAADLEGIADSFEGEDDGVLVPAGDALAFVVALDGLLDTKLTPAARQARRDRIASRYSWDCVIEEYLGAFQAVQDREAVGAQ